MFRMRSCFRWGLLGVIGLGDEAMLGLRFWMPEGEGIDAVSEAGVSPLLSSVVLEVFVSSEEDKTDDAETLDSVCRLFGLGELSSGML